MVTFSPERGVVPFVRVAVKVTDWLTAGVELVTERESWVGVAVGVGVGVAVGVGVGVAVGVGVGVAVGVAVGVGVGVAVGVGVGVAVGVGVGVAVGVGVGVAVGVGVGVGSTAVTVTVAVRLFTVWFDGLMLLNVMMVVPCLMP